jgi:uncharacterized DUF497 family protein
MPRQPLTGGAAVVPAVSEILPRTYGYERPTPPRDRACPLPYTRIVYTMHEIEFTWSEAKRDSNKATHDLDFIDAVCVFTGVTFTYEDNRFCYGERRYITFGLLDGTPVSIVHTETTHEIRIISFRKATRREAEIYFDEIRD